MLTVCLFVVMVLGFSIASSIIFWILKNEASHQRDAAQAARAIAETARRAEAVAENNAIVSRNDAIAGRNAADAARARAEVESYFASIFAADAAVKAVNYGDAQQFLEMAPPRFAIGNGNI